ncbi:hypothetical protein EVAR_23021_1 [Eumeta japonica]|uniref:Uncharacterized protein n=1 Tax=Eumeta variegata TaxID=151549 RepID=A0A4C1URF3_EUMVA|nr:hypothetical protein EVAR_23021_1 [Eumeta japonica]
MQIFAGDDSNAVCDLDTDDESCFYCYDTETKRCFELDSPAAPAPLLARLHQAHGLNKIRKIIASLRHLITSTLINLGGSRASIRGCLCLGKNKQEKRKVIERTTRVFPRSKDRWVRGRGCASTRQLIEVSKDSKTSWLIYRTLSPLATAPLFGSGESGVYSV